MARLVVVTTFISRTWKHRLRLPAVCIDRAPSLAEDPCLSTGRIDDERGGVAPWTDTRGFMT